MSERLYRSREDRMLAGVAGGVAEALDADPSLVRIVWALLTIFTGGLAFLVYVVMAIVVPETPEGWLPATARGAWVGGSEANAADPGSATPPTDPGTGEPAPPPGAPGAPATASWWQSDRDARRAARRARRAESDGRGGIIAGVILIVIGGFFLLRQFGLLFAWDLWWPVGLIGIGVLLVVLALFPRRPKE
jgi:phage shock protein PspC (stress-responsive transcriptional regulator)